MARHQSPKISRRGLLGSATAMVAAPTLAVGREQTTAAPNQPESKLCTSVPSTPTAKRPPAQESLDFSQAELQLGFRCHGMPAEALSEPITPLGRIIC
jgi:hypothetical protein